MKRKTSLVARKMEVSLDRVDAFIEGAAAFGFKAPGFEFEIHHQKYSLQYA